MEEPGGLQSLESDTTEQLNNKNNWEDSTFSGATEHVRHSYWAYALEHVSMWVTTAAPMPGACALQQETPLQWEARTPQQWVAPCSRQLEKACTQQWSLRAAKKKRDEEIIEG